MNKISIAAAAASAILLSAASTMAYMLDADQDADQPQVWIGRPVTEVFE